LVYKKPTSAVVQKDVFSLMIRFQRKRNRHLQMPEKKLRNFTSSLNDMSARSHQANQAWPWPKWSC